MINSGIREQRSKKSWCDFSADRAKTRSQWDASDLGLTTRYGKKWPKWDLGIAISEDFGGIGGSAVDTAMVAGGAARYYRCHLSKPALSRRRCSKPVTYRESRKILTALKVPPHCQVAMQTLFLRS